MKHQVQAFYTMATKSWEKNLGKLLDEGWEIHTMLPGVASEEFNFLLVKPPAPAVQKGKPDPVREDTRMAALEAKVMTCEDAILKHKNTITRLKAGNESLAGDLMEAGRNLAQERERHERTAAHNRRLLEELDLALREIEKLKGGQG